MSKVKNNAINNAKEVKNMADIAQLDKFNVIMGLVDLIKGVHAAKGMRDVQEDILDISNNTDKLTQNLKIALDAVLFNDDYEKTSKIVKYISGDLLDGSGNMYYDPNLIVTVILPNDLKDILIDFLMEPDANFQLIAEKMIKEFGKDTFQNILFEELSKWDPYYSFCYITKIRPYLNTEEIAKLTIDRYNALSESEKEEIMDDTIKYFSPEEKHMITEVANETDRKFSF